jgi:eukaryotic-like serine/threonine-protein kinase
MTLPAGTHLGPYEVLAPIGVGGMGEVYRAWDRKLDRNVAIKVLPESVAADPDKLARFEREAKAVAALSHTNILSIFDFGTHEGISYAVMELLEGETLRAKLSAGPISQKQAVDYALQIARGLSAAHEKGVVHRDLKPENLFVAKDGHLKILDFGLAKRVEVVAPGEETSAPTASQHTERGVMMGTLGYMSPEQVRGLPVDHRTDIFSFGTVLYELLSGERAFKRDTASDTMAAILNEEPRDFSDRRMPRKLKSSIRQLLEKDPAKRYASAQEVYVELQALESSLSPSRHAELSRIAWIAITVAVVAVTAVAAWLWQRASRTRWALETATPEIARLEDAGEFAKAAALALDARAVLTKDPTLEKLWMRATGEASIESLPSGCDVSIRLYRTTNPNDWKSLGKTPLKIRVPKDYYFWRIAKPGFATLSFIDGPPFEGVRAKETVVAWKSGQRKTLKLFPEASVPPEMVVVSGSQTGLGWPLEDAPRVKLDDYLIDRHEVTNEEYKKFVDAGGYQKRDFWEQPFVKDGKMLPWEQAVAFFRDTTGRPGPATWEAGSFPKGKEKHPVAGVSWYEAAAYAEFAGKSLPTIYHWTCAAQTFFGMMIAPGSNFSGIGTAPVGGPGTLSGFGTTDMAGNVKEWCWNESSAGKRFILGGGYGEPTYMFNQADAQSPWFRGTNYGFRCVKLASPTSPAAAARIVPPVRDFWKEEPVSDEVFRAFKGLYAYDKGELNARVEEAWPTADWTREKVSFDAAYGGERVIAQLILPKNAAPPFQTVVYFPAMNALLQNKFDASWMEENKDFLLKSGRAVMFPIYKGTFERRDDLKPGGPGANPPALWRDHMIMWSKDLGRSLDYLQTRKDIDNTRIAYLGFSLGGGVAPILLAVEERFKAAILLSGGFYFRRPLPEADGINFVTRVGIPVLMLNGRYDANFPAESSQLPLFRRLGTPDKDKKYVIYEAGHGNLPRREEIRESLDWLDKYLGPVKR